jgi:hypothetical protein
MFGRLHSRLRSPHPVLVLAHRTTAPIPHTSCVRGHYAVVSQPSNFGLGTRAQAVNSGHPVGWCQPSLNQPASLGITQRGRSGVRTAADLAHRSLHRLVKPVRRTDNGSMGRAASSPPRPEPLCITGTAHTAARKKIKAHLGSSSVSSTEPWGCRATEYPTQLVTS